MADANASSDFLPQIGRERADSTMSLGGGFTLPENGENHSNGAGSLPGDSAPATTAPPPNAPSGDERMVQDVLSSEVNFVAHAETGLAQG